MATIQDVARLAGVSTATVSRYLSGNPVRASAKVGDVIDDLRYRPSVTARGLRSGRHLAIGVVVPDITNPFFASVTRGIENVVGPVGLQVTLANSDESVARESDLVEALVPRVDGVILCPATENDAVPEHLVAAGVPVVLVDRGVHQESVGFDLVSVDNAGGAAAAARHLRELGHRRIAVVSGPLTSTPGRERHEGFLDGLAQGGLEPAHAEIADFKESGGYAATQHLLALDPPVTAVFLANNLMTVGALKALHEAGVDVPGDLSVVGFDDLDLGALLAPPLTVIDRPTVEQGEQAARLLLDRLADPTHRPTSIVMPVQLLVRGSSAAPSSCPSPHLTRSSS